VTIKEAGMTDRKAITREAVEAAMRESHPTSLTGLAHALGYRGSVGGGVARRIREMVPGIEDALAANRAAKDIEAGATKGETTSDSAKAAPKGKPAARQGQKPATEPMTKPGRRWKRDPRNPYREGSAYGCAFDILAAHRKGLARTRLVELLAEATGKDSTHARFDAHVVLTAWGNEEGLSRNDGPRHRSARPGYWVKRANGQVTLMVD
jgi:hypothetical protein